MRHRHVAVGSGATRASRKPRRRNHRSSLLGRRHLTAGHPAGRHLVVQARRRWWALQNLRRLVGSSISVRGVVKSFLHREARRWLRAHLALGTTIVPGEIGLLRHLSWLLLLRTHTHQQFVALSIWGRGRSHEVHQELSVAVVTSSVGTTGALTRFALALTNKILQKLFGASSLLLRSRGKNLLNMVRRGSAQGSLHASIRSILLERRIGGGDRIWPASIWRGALRSSKR